MPDIWSDWLNRTRFTAATTDEAQAAMAFIAGIRQRLVSAAAPALGQTVLELGCGTGEFLPALLSAVGPQGSVLALDISAELLAQARAAVASHPLAHRVRWLHADMADLPLETAGVDAVVARSVLQYAETTLPAVTAGLARVLRPGGRLAAFELLHGDATALSTVEPAGAMAAALDRWRQLPFALRRDALEAALPPALFCPLELEAHTTTWRQAPDPAAIERSLQALPRPGCPPLGVVYGPEAAELLRRADCVQECGAWCFVTATRTTHPAPHAYPA